MADNDQTPIDLDTLTDEEFLKLDPSQLQAYVPLEGDSNANDSKPNADVPLAGSEDPANGEEQKPEGEQSPAPEEVTQPFKPEVPAQADPVAKPTSVQAPAEPAPGTTAKVEDPKPEEKPSAVQVPVTDQAAMAFYKTVTAPFKADGKDIQVRTPEDAVRLMQMGVNYSRRMQEMKPMRAQAEMLKANGLDNPDKLNFMIELMQGKPEAIQKLLKDKKIDPIDIDTSKESNYRPANYQADTKTQAFKDAIEHTMASEGGKELIADINSGWDDVSKEALRDQPAIFQNLLDQKNSGVYVKIKKELDYQRTMGFLTNVPFVQAYHQVGEAMQKAGVFGPNLTPKPKNTEVQSQVPLDTGTRKAAQSGAPAPNLSSTQQPRTTPSKDGGSEKQPDYWAMSDEDFLKLKPPS